MSDLEAFNTVVEGLRDQSLQCKASIFNIKTTPRLSSKSSHSFQESRPFCLFLFFDLFELFFICPLHRYVAFV